MFQTLGEALPIMPTEIRKLRSALMNAGGIHLFYNVPRKLGQVAGTGPVAPFAGLCIGVLLYVPNDLTGVGFNIKVGKDERKYIIGFNARNSWGLHSATYWTTDPKNSYPGTRLRHVKTFKKGYSYVYFYFKSSNTLHGWVNDKYDLMDDNTHPYPVNEANKSISCSLYESSVDVKCLEIHWVAWGSSHNLSGAPSSTLVDQLFPKNSAGIVDFKDADIFEMRTGTVVFVRTKYIKNAGSSKTGVIIGVGCATCTNQDVTSQAFPECTKTNEVYTFRINISEKGALIYTNEGDASYLAMASIDASKGKCRAYLTFNNVKLVEIQVETMGQSWV